MRLLGEFVGYRHQWSADWHHSQGYVGEASKVLRNVDVEAWCRAMKEALWQRDRPRADELVREAKRQRLKRLPSHLEKCPVVALATYLSNSWRYFRFAQFQEAGLPTVSAPRRALHRPGQSTKSPHRCPDGEKQGKGRAESSPTS